MNVRYRVELSQTERDELKALLSGGRHAARKLKRAQILLAADAGVSDEEIAGSVGVGGSTVYRTKRRFVIGNLEAALSEEPRPGADRKLSGKEEALLVATACSNPPEGRARWTLELLADELVRLTEHDTISRETVRRRLAENELKPWRKDMWCIPQVDGEFVARMEDVLDLYAEQPDRRRPVVCFDESPTQLIGEVRQPIKAKPGQLERYDCEYKRNGTANLFIFLDVHRPWRKVKVTDRRTAIDFATCMRELVDVHFPKAERIRVVLDNLSTHTAGALYQAFPPAEARRLLHRLEFHYTPIRMMATVHRCGEGFLVAVKGAPEAVLAQATRLAGPQGDSPLDLERRELIRAKVEELGQQGLRVLAIAEHTAPAQPGVLHGDLTLLGLVGLHDPPRPDVREAIAACRGAGIRVIMVTGDHAVTAASIARSVSLGSEPHVIEGRALANGGKLSAADVLHADVLARVSPSQKLDLVSAYQAAGDVVAMTGDGVNDAPALRKADIGVAMGQRGTEVARQAAVMVLRDDAFAIIVAAIREGRVIFANIRRFVMYLLACNLSEVMVVGIAVAVGLPLPLLPLQILFLNLVTDVFPAFALAMGEGGEDVMRRPPRDPQEPIVTRPLWTLIVAQGLIMMLATLTAMVLARDVMTLEGSAIVTVSFLTLAMAQIWHVFNMADPGQPLLVNDVTRNPFVWGAVLACLGLIAAACYVPPVAQVLKLTSPDARAWAVVLATSLASMVLARMATVLIGRWFAASNPGRVPNGPA